MNNQLKMGIKTESEHKGTIKFIKDFKKKYGRFPSNTAIFTHIAMEHLKEDPNYYTKIKKYKL